MVDTSVGVYCTCGTILDHNYIGFNDETGDFYCTCCMKTFDIVELVKLLLNSLRLTEDALIEIEAGNKIDLFEKIERLEERIAKVNDRVTECIIEQNSGEEEPEEEDWDDDEEEEEE